MVFVSGVVLLLRPLGTVMQYILSVFMMSSSDVQL